MKNYFKLCVILSLLNPTLLIAKESDYLPYVFKKGDVLSVVLQEHELAPLYGKNEWVQKVLKLNRLTEDSARTMEPGDVVVLPLKATFFVGTAFEDEVKSIEAASVKRSVERLQAESNKSRLQNFKLGTEIFLQNYSFDSGAKVDINQNIKVFAEYQKRDTKKDKGFVLEPKAQIGLYAQSQADFESDDTLSADFTPSFYTTAALEIREKSSNYSIAPQVEFESFTALFHNNGNFRVDRKQMVWGGLEAAKYFERSAQTYYLKALYKRGTSLDAQMGQAKFGAIFKKHYKLELNVTRKEMNLDEKAKINSAGLTFGYNF